MKLSQKEVTQLASIVSYAMNLSRDKVSWADVVALIKHYIDGPIPSGDSMRKRVVRLTEAPRYSLSQNPEDASSFILKFKIGNIQFLVVTTSLSLWVFNNETVNLDYEYYSALASEWDEAEDDWEESDWEESDDEYDDDEDYTYSAPKTYSKPFEPLKHLLTDNSLVLVTDNGQPYSIGRDHKFFDKIYEAVLSGDQEAVNVLKDMRNTIDKIHQGLVTVDETGTYISGKLVSNSLAQKLKVMLYNGQLDAGDRLIKFLNLVSQNPSYRVFNVLYDFAAQNDIEIDEDGYLLCYKKIQANWTDCHSGTIDNSVGQKPTVERREVDEDMNRTCSYGLHVCSYNYLAYFGGQRVVLVRVNPADVVAIPADYNNSKMRVCSYEVLKEITDVLDSYKNVYDDYN